MGTSNCPEGKTFNLLVTVLNVKVDNDYFENDKWILVRESGAPFKNWNGAVFEKIRRRVLLVVCDAVKIHLQRILAKGSQAHQGLEVVAYAPLQAALVIDFAADQKSCEQ
jgi:hypothetical protein